MIFWPRSGFGWSIDTLLTLGVALSGETQTTSAACFTSCLSHTAAAFARCVEGKSFSPERTVNTTSYFHQVKLDKISITLGQVTGNSVPSPSAFRNRFTLPQAKPAVLLDCCDLRGWLTDSLLHLNEIKGWFFLYFSLLWATLWMLYWKSCQLWTSHDTSPPFLWGSYSELWKEASNEAQTLWWLFLMTSIIKSHYERKN